jgi:hypothetical protein
MIDLGSFLASHKSKLFLEMRGTAALPSNPPNRRGTSPFWQPHDVSFGWGRAEKVVTFLNNISQTKASVEGLNKAFFHHLRHQKGVKRALKGVYIA